MKVEKKYEWIRRARMVFIDPFYGPVNEKEFNAKKIVDIVLKAKGNGVRFGAVGFGWVCYNSSVLPKKSDMGDRDLLREFVDECRKHEIRVIPYVNVRPDLDKVAYRLHPDWAERDADGNPISSDRGYFACPNNPNYRKALLTMIEEIVQNYDIDALYTDGPDFRYYCFCHYCRQNFKERHGFEPPRVIWPEFKREDQAFRLYLEERYRSLERFYDEIARKVKAIKDIPLIFNAFGYCHGPPGHGRRTSKIPERCIKYYDGMLMEPGMNFINKLERCKFAVSTGKAAWIYSPKNPYWEWPRVSFDTLDEKADGLAILAHGGNPVIAAANPLIYEETGLGRVRELFTFMEDNENFFFDFQQTKFIALPYSRQTDEWYEPEGEAKPSLREMAFEPHPTSLNHFFLALPYSGFYRGAFSALTHAHHQFTPIFDENLRLENLRQFKALVLANVACLSNQQIEAVKKYVREGGGLVATYETSLYDEQGYMREDFGLREVFKASYQDKKAKWMEQDSPECYMETVEQHPVLEGFPIGKLLPISDYLLTLTSREAYVMATVLVPNQGEKWPCVVANTYGKGRVVYIASGIERLYLKRVFPPLRRLISNSVNWVTRNELPYRIEAPPSVITNLSYTEDKMALHLVNRAIGDVYETSFFKIEDIAPVTNLTVSVKTPEGKSTKKVALLLSRKEVPYKEADGYCKFNIPQVKEYEAALLEYE